MIKKAVIPAAGKGTRLLPATHAQPKEMLPCGSKPTIQYVVEELEAAGIRDVLIITGSAKRALEDHLENFFGKEETNMNLFFTRQPEPTGLAKAVELAKDFTDTDPFLVALGDTIIYSEPMGDCLKRLIQLHDKNKGKATIMLEAAAKQDVSKYGIIKGKQSTEEVWQLLDLVEKPSLQAAPSHLAICGRYIFEPDIYSAIEKIERGVGNEYQLTDAIKFLLKGGAEVWGLKIHKNEKRYDIGDLITYAISFIELSLRDPKIGDALRHYLTDEKYKNI